MLVSLGLTLSACPPKPQPPPNPPTDDSPPGFLYADIRLENRDGQPGPSTEGISILAQDVTRKVSRLHRIRITAAAGDPQSWITNLSLATVTGHDGQGNVKNYNVSWKCASTPGGLQSLLMLEPLTTTPPIAQPGPLEISRIDVTVDPVGQAECQTGTLEGFIRVVATNGTGGTSSTKTFHFEFLP